MNIQGWFSLGLTGLISFLFKRLSRIFSSTTIRKHQFFGTQFSMVQLSQPYMTTGKTIALTIQTFVGKVMFCFLIHYLGLSSLFSQGISVLISWLWSPSAVILEPKTIKSVTVPFYLLCSNGIECHDFSFLNVVLSQLFYSHLPPSLKGSLVLCFLPLVWYHLYIWGCW